MAGQVLLYSFPNFVGNPITLMKACNNVPEAGFVNGASSIDMTNSTTTWEVFKEVNYGGDMAVLNPGVEYRSLFQMHIQRPVMSLRPSA